jgi:hypothetical protein
LDHAERRARAGKRVPVPARTDKRIDMSRQILLRADLRGEQNHE